MKLLLFQFGSEWLILETNDFHLETLAKLSKYHFINMSVFYMAVGLEYFIHCSCGLKNKLTVSVELPIFKYNAFHGLYTLV